MGTYTKTIPSDLAVHYKDLLELEDCSVSYPQYTFFQAKNKNWQVTFYKSGKVVVQGKEIDYIVSKLFEDGGLKKETVKTHYEGGEIAPYPHIGTDESGKGDFFGPLVVAGCYLTEKNAIEMKKAGAADSKKLDDKKILALADIIKENSVFEIVVIGNKKYNELYKKFKNLNRLLAWGHATVLENILLKTDAETGVSDKFGDEKLILNALKEKGRQIKLIQEPRAESDTAVACASILARAEFVKRISKMSFDYGINFPKGAGEAVLVQGRKFVNRFGIEELKNVSKTHFKTYENISSSQISLF